MNGGRAGFVCLGISVAAAGCKFPYPDAIDVDAATEVDATVDASIACVPDSIVCDDALGVYTDCSSDGVAELQIQCPLGCATDMEKCVDIDPSNDLAMYLDMVDNPPDLVLSGQSVIYSDDGGPGSIIAGGESVVVPNFRSSTGIQVFVVRSLVVTGTARLPAGSAASLPAAFLSLGDVAIEGLLDLSADGSDGGPSANGSAGCKGGELIFPAANPPDGGGGGGGGAEAGGDGARTPAAGGIATNIEEPLRGGCAGGSVVRNWGQSHGGGGGGALQITSRTSIRVSNAGVIDASGGGGTYFNTATANLAGAGGGAGGTILLEAPQVVLDGPSVVVSTKGGSGAGSGTSSAHNGLDGGYTAGPAPGGASNTTSPGGAGGDGATAPTKGITPEAASHDGGGGGGAAGLAVFRTSAGLIIPQNGAAVLSKQQTTRIRTRMLP